MVGDPPSMAQQEAPALCITLLLSVAYWETLCPPGKSFLSSLMKQTKPAFLLVPGHTRCVLTAEKHRNPWRFVGKPFQAGKHFWKTVNAPPAPHQHERKAFQSCMRLLSGIGSAAFRSPGWCKDPQQPGGESPGLIAPLLPPLTTSTITCSKPVSSCSFTKNFTWNTSSNKTTAAACKISA